MGLEVLHAFKKTMSNSETAPKQKLSVLFFLIT
jgi:hypothetical protein